MAVKAGHQKHGWLSLERIAFQGMCLVLFLVTAAAAASEECPKFIFPTLPPDRTITAVEHSRLTIPFSLNTDACTQQENQTFYIYVDPQRNDGDYCIVRLMDGDYLSYNEDKCSVRKENGKQGVDVVKTVSREDSGTWLWRTSDGAVRVEVYFNIQRSPRSDDNNDDEDTNIDRTPAPAAREKTIKRPKPAASKPPSANDDSADKANEGTRTSSFERKLQPDGNPETSKMERAGNEWENTMEEKSTKGYDDEKPVDGSVTTGIIVGMVNVITIVAVVVVVFFLVRRHSRRTKRHPRDSMPPLPNDARLPGQRQEPPSDVTNKYNTIDSVTSSHYEPLPEPRESIAVDKDGYLEPEKAMKDISGTYIELIN